MAKVPKPQFLHAPRPHHKAKPKSRKAVQAKADAMTDVRWKKVIAAIANGGTRDEAAKKAGITTQTIDAYLISNISAYKQLRDAMLINNRRSWPTDLIEHIFDDLAMGMTLKAAALKNGVASDRMSSLYRIVRHDKQIREAYDDARELQAESFLDEVIDIADDSGDDRLENGRINHEVVNRSKLRIETRRFAMGSMVKKRFGDTKHVEHEGNITLNHIATLTGARKRLEKLRPGTAPTKVPVLIENETGDIAEANSGEAQ
jgi:hypothetical protein